MKQLIARLCLWILAKVGYRTDIVLSPSVMPFADEIAALVAEENGLTHGAVDVLGDSWLKFRRVATKLKKNHPDVLKRDIFKAIILVHEALESNVST